MADTSHGCRTIMAYRSVAIVVAAVRQPTASRSGRVISAHTASCTPFKRAGDPTLRDINVRAFVDAANRTFPGWLRHLVDLRFALVTVGSLLVIVLLAMPAANPYFR